MHNVVALVSGGKDSSMNMVRCTQHGHTIVALANIFPAVNDGDELDSFMYQTVGHEGIEAISECMDLPLYRRPVRKGTSLSTELEYSSTQGDEVEELYTLLAYVKRDMPHVTAVASGAILSNYQRTRVESVCMRLGLTSLAYLWMEDQASLMDDIVNAGVQAIIIKVACMGLGTKHLGKELSQMRATLHRLNAEYGAHICGEGGEFETFTLDCPLYRKRIVLESSEPVSLSDDEYAPVAYLRMTGFRLEDKEGAPPLRSEGGAGVIMVEGSAELRAEEAPHPAPQAVTGGPAGEKWKHTTLRMRTALGREGGGSAGTATTVEEEAAAVLSSMEQDLAEAGVPGGWSGVYLVGVYLSKMSDFAAVNSVYAKHLPMRCPPARLCVATDLANGARVAIECAASPQGHETLHVQSVSQWAPSNIGPYSQAKTLGGRLVVVSGQIALDPASMALGGGGSVVEEAEACIRNLKAILGACGAGLGDGVRVTVWATEMRDAGAALSAWLGGGATGDCCANVVCVKELPRGAKVELQLACIKGVAARDGVHEGVSEEVGAARRTQQDGSMACTGVPGEWCSAAVVGDACLGGKECGRLLGQSINNCLSSCRLTAADIVAVRVFYACSEVGVDQGLADGLEEGIAEQLGAEGARVQISVLAVRGILVHGVEGKGEVCAELLAVRFESSV